MVRSTNPKEDFISFCKLSVSLFNNFNKKYKYSVMYRISEKKRLLQEEDNVSISLNLDPKPGLKLDTITKDKFESAFDANLENVVVHTGEYASELTRSANAEAVTIGSDIYFSQGGFSMDTEEGIILLVHELQHVIQHNNGEKLTCQEDIILMETQADRVESIMKETNFHSFTTGILNQSDNPEIEKQHENYENRMAISSIGEDGGIDDFSNSNTEIIYRLKIGHKVYEVTRKERDLIISRAVDKLDEKFCDELALSSIVKSDENLLNFMIFIES